MIHIHVDVDDLWIYAEEYGAPADSVTESVYSEALPRFLELLDEVSAKATFFVVGRDVQAPAARAFCREAADRGHELANHTYSHPIAFHSLSEAEKEREIREADGAIAEAAGVKPVGFRAPGYYLDGTIVDVLARNGYVYDSSILPTFVQPLFKLYIRATSGQQIDKQFGTGRSPLVSQRVQKLSPPHAAHFLYELPISVLPLLRLPIHSTFSFHFPPTLRRLAYATLKRRPNGVLLFHAIDALGEPRDPVLRRKVLPLRLDPARRIALLREGLAVTRGDAMVTTRSSFDSLDPATVPWSRVLRWKN